MIRNKAVTQISTQRGFTLVELMVALLLGLLLSGAIVSVFLEGKNNFIQDDEVARVQENGRYALRLLSREIGMAGFFGGEPDAVDVNGGSVSGDDCGPADKDWLLVGMTLKDPDALSDHIASPLEILDSADASVSDYYECLDGLVETSTDILVVKRVSDAAVIEDGVWQDPVSELDANRYYLWTSNRGQGETILKQGSNFSSADLSNIVSADSGSDVWEYKAATFYVGTDTDNQPSLCKKELEASGGGVSDQRCLVQGIENIQYELGMDIDGDDIPDQFISDDSFPPVVGGQDASSIVAVRIHVLVRSLNEIRSMPAASKSFRLGGGATITTPTDQFFRMVMSSTVSIRNPTSIGGS